jgi:hypothetical protein
MLVKGFYYGRIKASFWAMMPERDAFFVAIIEANRRFISRNGRGGMAESTEIDALLAISEAILLTSQL